MTNIAAPQDVLIHIADLHFWQVVTQPLRLLNKRFWGNLTVVMRRRHKFGMDRAERFADAVAATGVRTVLLTGDFASTSLESEFARGVAFAEGLRARGLTVHLLPGNHDVYTYGAFRQKRFERYFADFLPSGGYPAHVTLPGGTPLILAPTVCPRHFSARGFVSQETIETVAGLIGDCGRQVVVAAHYPLLHATHGYASHLFRRLENAGSLRRVLGESRRRILYVAGHVHRFSYQRDTGYPEMKHLTTGPFFRSNHAEGSDGEFTEIHVADGDFRIIRRLHRQEWDATDIAPRHE